MKNHFYKKLPHLFFCSLFLCLSSCCNTVECDLAAATISFSLFKNDKNALFGEHRLYHPQQIRVRSEPPNDFINFSIDSIAQVLTLTTIQGFDYFLQLDTLTVDTIDVQLAIIPEDIFCCCCRTTLIKSVHYNDKMICTDTCSTSLRIEL